MKISVEEIFATTKVYPKLVILEISDFEKDESSVQVYARESGKLSHREIMRHFAYSSAGHEVRQKVIDEFRSRHRIVSGEECVLVCGETGITKVRRQKCDRLKGESRHRIEDDLGFMKELKRAGSRILLCPFHSAYRRYEIRVKKKHYSTGNRLVVSTWNFDHTMKAQSKLQWCAFKNGKDITDQIRLLPYHCKGRPDIKVGLLQA